MTKPSRILTPFLWRSTLLLTITVFSFNCSDDSSSDTTNPPILISPDINDDGKLNILILGTSQSINNNSGAFASDKISEELNNILSQDSDIELELNISFEDIYKEKVVTFGLGQAGNVFDWNHYCHSLLQYYYWPDGQDEREQNLSGNGLFDWDYVIIASDPYIIAKLPGYYALGVNKIASKITEGGAIPLLVMSWAQDEMATTSINHFAEYTRRTADNAIVDIETLPSARAWDALPSTKKDEDVEHPTPNGAYLVAASIYSQMVNRSASASSYVYDDEIADIAFTAKTNESDFQYSGQREFISPFSACNIDDITLNYNHTGTSSENGILSGLQWVVNQSDHTLVMNGTPPINFNYGRSNTNFEPHKRYNIDPTQFDYSIGFPMQDHANHGNTSMLYGLDKRVDEVNNSTDLGTALYMVRNSELPYARAIPVRTLYAILKESIPSQSAYGDSWHMHGNLNKSIGAFMYTLLTGGCDLSDEPMDHTSVEWQTWMSYKIGYETAYTLMNLNGVIPNCN